MNSGVILLVADNPDVRLALRAFQMEHIAGPVVAEARP